MTTFEDSSNAKHTEKFGGMRRHDVATSDILHSTFDIRHFQDVISTHHNIATSITLQTFTVILTFQIFEALVFGAGTRYSAV